MLADLPLSGLDNLRQRKRTLAACKVLCVESASKRRLCEKENARRAQEAAGSSSPQDVGQGTPPSSIAEVCLTPGVDRASRSQLEMIDAKQYDEGYDKELLGKEANATSRPSWDYVTTKQLDITVRMRSILVDWMVEVCQDFNLLSDTLFLAVSCLDRYLSLTAVQASELQLVGVTCLWVAAKYEEIQAPSLQLFCEVTDFCYSAQQLLATEKQVLACLQYKLTVPTAKTFLRLQMSNIGSNAELYLLASYLLELALLDYTCLRFLPSQLAAASLVWASSTLGVKVERSQLSALVGGGVPHLWSCIRHLALLHVASSDSGNSSVKNKYRKAAFCKVADLTPAAGAGLF